MSDTLEVNSPQGRTITNFTCDYEAIADRAIQLQTTGEETLELADFVLSIIEENIEVQEGMSIDALKDMALSFTVGLHPMGDYFCTLAASTWAYADACRIAGDLTGFMVDRLSNLSNSLALIVAEREIAEGLLYDAENLSDDETMRHGYLTPYLTLDETGAVSVPSDVVMLAGLDKTTALA